MKKQSTDNMVVQQSLSGLTDVVQNAKNEKKTPSDEIKKKKKDNLPSVRNSRKTGGGKNEDIMKELEEYVHEKKQTNKYLDDISDLDGLSTNNTA